MGVIVGLWLICAVVSGVIGANKGNSFGGYFFVGLLLGIFGVIIAAVASGPGQTKLGQLTPAAAAGWHRDPTGRFDRRYYDGQRWTMHVTRDADQQQFEDPI